MNRDDPALAGACGTYCGACLAFHGEAAARSAELHELLRRQGFLALARRLEPAERHRIDAFFEVLDRIARTPACPGCGGGGGVVGCPVRACAGMRGGSTCAACPELRPCAAGTRRPAIGRGAGGRRRDPALHGASPFPFTASQLLARLCRKYDGWNLRNLEAIRDQGLAAWLRRMAVNPAFRTVSVKRPDDVFGDD
jgi:hypothetical protein